MNLVGLSGSLRRGSFNTALLRAAAELMPEGAELTVRTVNGIPLYDGDREATEGIPRAVDDLKQAIVASDGLLLATPEYNNSIPGVLKNAIDWLTRPVDDIPRVFFGKPVAVIGARRDVGEPYWPRTPGCPCSGFYACVPGSAGGFSCHRPGKRSIPRAGSSMRGFVGNCEPSCTSSSNSSLASLQRKTD